MYNAYNQTYPDMTPFFDTIIKNNKQKGFRILVYNGDVDMICNFLGDSWFIENLATSYGVDVRICFKVKNIQGRGASTMAIRPADGWLQSEI